MDKNINRTFKNLILVVIAAAITLIGAATLIVHAAQSTVNLGTAAPFAILAGTPNITDAGNSSVINGNVGLSPATGAGIGLMCAQVTGAIYSVDATGPLPCRTTDGPLLVTAKNDLTTAYNDAAGRTPVTTVPTELGGTTVVAGVYDSASTTFGITAGAGPLVIDGQNDPSSVFIFEAGFSGTGLNVGPGSVVSLVNGAQACNIFWRVDTANIDTTANFKGSILALNSITVANGATIEGRLLARNGNVTLINDTITVPTCASTPGGENPSGENPGDGATDTPSTPTPGFPNTGFLSISTAGWIMIAVSTVLLIGLIIYLARKKHLI